MSARSSSVSGRPSSSSRSSICAIRLADSSRTMSSSVPRGRKNLTACRYLSSMSMIVLREDFIERGVDAAPFDEPERQHPRAVVRQTVKALVALGLFAPLAYQEALALEPTQKRVERALVDFQPALAQHLAQRVAVLLGSQGGQHRDGETPAPELKLQVVE